MNNGETKSLITNLIVLYRLQHWLCLATKCPKANQQRPLTKPTGYVHFKSQPKSQRGRLYFGYYLLSTSYLQTNLVWKENWRAVDIVKTLLETTPLKEFSFFKKW